jgi:basic membrane protein A and related proteins
MTVERWNRRDWMRAAGGLAAASAAPWVLAQKPMSIGVIYVGPRDDYGYNQAQAECAALVKKLPGV